MWSLFFPLAVVYLELVFIFSTDIAVDPWLIVGLLISGAMSGCLIILLSSLFKQKLINRTVRALLLLSQSVLFALIYFVYCEFGVFYSLMTISNAAGDAVGEFSYNIKVLLLSPSGILHIILFLLPVIIYLVFIKKDEAKGLGFTGLAFSAALVLLFAGMYLKYVDVEDDTRHAYTDEYDFDRAVRLFGVNTAARLDIEEAVPGLRKHSENEIAGGFVIEAPSPTVAPAEPMPAPAQNTSAGTTQSENSISVDEAEADPEEIVYTPNVLDIDFAALAETTSGDLQGLDLYVASLTPSMKNEYTGLFEGKNLILITAEAFSAEAIDEERTPTLYRMATKGIQFTDFYQPTSAGTTGGEYSVIMGMLPTSGGSSMLNTRNKLNYMTMGYQLNQLGYYGMMYHNNSYTYYNRNVTHINFGYSNGYMGYGNGVEKFVKHTWPESDLEMIEGSLPTYIDKQPFNIYYMSVSGHSLYSLGSNAMSKKHWDTVKDLDYSDTVKAYLACQVELDAAMEYLIDELEKEGIADDTVIVICADHFPYGLDSTADSVGKPMLTELYGEPITNNIFRDHNRLIIWSGALEEMDPIIVDTPTFSPDITPTLLNLFGVDFDSRLMVGRDVLSDAQPLMFNLGYEWKTDLGTYTGGHFTPVSDDVEIPDGYVESIKTMVKNKINFCKKCVSTDYYSHVFPDAPSSLSPVTYGSTTYTPAKESTDEENPDMPVDVQLPADDTTGTDPNETVIPENPDGTVVPNDTVTPVETTDNQTPDTGTVTE